MGVPKFYSQFIKRSGFKGIIQKDIPYASSLSIDMNQIFHKAAQISYAYGDFGKTDEGKIRRERNKSVDPNILKKEFFWKVADLLNQVIQLVQPRDLLVLAVDGVAPMAKISQQRQRRYKNATGDPVYGWDPNSITPGTPLMESLDMYMRDWMKTNITALPPKVIYSSYEVPGEGEHKIIDFMRQRKYRTDNGSHILYGLDADLIVLALTAPLQNIFLFREDLNKEILSIDNLKSAIEFKMYRSSSSIDDFALMTMLLGNDFLPHPVGFGDVGKAIDTMIKTYNGLKIRYPKFALTTYYETEMKGSTEEKESVLRSGIYVIRWNDVAHFLVELSKEEPTMIEKEVVENIEYQNDREKATNDNTVYKYRSSVFDASVAYGGFDFEVYRSVWYERSLKISRDMNEPTPEAVREMSIAYLKCLGWMFSYYKHGMVSIDTHLFYPYYYAPLVLDLADALYEVIPSGYLSRGEKPINMAQQLTCVLPPKSISLIPFEAHTIINSYPQYFPTDFDVDYEGIRNDWQGIALIPFLTAPWIQQEFSKIEGLPEKYRTIMSNIEITRKEEDTELLQTNAESRKYIETLLPKVEYRVRTEGKPADPSWKRNVQTNQESNRGISNTPRGRGGMRGAPRGRGASRGGF